MRVTLGTLCPDATGALMSILGCTEGDDAEGMTSGSLRPDVTDVDGGADVFETLIDPRRHVDAEVLRNRSECIDDLSFVDPEDPKLPHGSADASSSSSSFDSRASSVERDDEDTLDERLREKRGISEEIVLVVPSPADRAVAPPPGHFSLFENYFDQCLLWFPLPQFLMCFLAAHSACLAQINLRGIRHLIGVYVLSRECGVDISTEHLSYLTDFRVRGRSDELKHSVTNASGMALIAGFPRKDDHFEGHFFFLLSSQRRLSRRSALALSRQDGREEVTNT
ncbi:hypothetical protein AALP_AAs50665U000700 [Arabis alpina]|uniref:Uncharacterized protein n=1 Tax=Arabis alpina TaxID=50452 RepID=A0A087FX58_ARAAL|nr:hypothetical protein AALP_AAs50665U000700 [Arabis alpina]